MPPLVSKWFHCNRLTLNLKKCNFVIFCTINKPYPKDLAKLSINGTEITQVKSTKFLGVIIDERLNWDDHIDSVCKRSTEILGILRKILPSIHPSVYLTLYYSFIYPYLNYCNIVWAATCPTRLNKLKIIQKRFMRIITHSDNYAPSAPLFRKFSILPIDSLNIYQICIFAHKFTYHIHDLPHSFENFFRFTSNVHSHNTRYSVNTLYLPPSRISGHQQNISFRAPKLWSDLNLSLRSISSLPLFKKHLKDHLLP